jgi:hypothetical protein
MAVASMALFSSFSLVGSDNFCSLFKLDALVVALINLMLREGAVCGMIWWEL